MRTDARPYDDVLRPRGFGQGRFLMPLYRISVELDGHSEARALTEQMLDLGAPSPSASSCFEIPDTGRWRVDAYVDGEPQAHLLIAMLGMARSQNLRIEPVPDENWVAISQAALPPVVAGRFIVHGSHDQAVIGRRANAIEIDAGEAFGTAHHASTEGCLIAIDRLTRRRTFQRVLDLGCGSGVLSIAAARRLPHARLVASDIDALAITVARANMRLNLVQSRVATVTAAGLAHTALRGIGRFDLVIANILAGPLVALAPSVARAVASGGAVVLSGLLLEQAREVLAVYACAGFRLRRRIVLAGWATLVIERRAMLNPASSRFKHAMPVA